MPVRVGGVKSARERESSIRPAPFLLVGIPTERKHKREKVRRNTLTEMQYNLLRIEKTAHKKRRPNPTTGLCGQVKVLSNSSFSLPCLPTTLPFELVRFFQKSYLFSCEYCVLSLSLPLLSFQNIIVLSSTCFFRLSLSLSLSLVLFCWRREEKKTEKKKRLKECRKVITVRRREKKKNPPAYFVMAPSFILFSTFPSLS